MYQLLQDNRPTSTYFMDRSRAQSHASLENMGSDMSTFSVMQIDDLPSEILFSNKHAVIHS